MAEEGARGYEVIRGSALIAACGAFEYLIKAVFVDQATIQPDKAADLLTGTKIRMPASDVLGLPLVEQWYAIADELFKLPADGQMHGRVKRMLSEYVYLPQGAEQRLLLVEALADVDIHKFNEAFLIRNCLVHNGGRVSLELARHTNVVAGQRIVFRDGVLRPLLMPMQHLAYEVNSLWIGIL